MKLIKAKEFLQYFPREYHNFSSLGPYKIPIFGWMYFGRIKAIIREIKKLDREFSETLEVGSGFGLFSVNFKYQFPNVKHYMVDIMSLYIGNIVKGVFQNKLRMEMAFEFECDVQCNVPFEDNKFDLIFVLDVLEHVENAEVALDEIFRITRSDGLIFISVPTESILLGCLRKSYSKIKLIETNPHWNGKLKSEKAFYQALVKKNVHILMKKKYPYHLLPRIFSYDMFYLIQKK